MYSRTLCAIDQRIYQNNISCLENLDLDFRKLKKGNFTGIVLLLHEQVNLQSFSKLRRLI